MMDWAHIAGALDRDGYAVIPGLLDPGRCRAVVDLWSQDGLYRKRIEMARHGYGQGAYKYFAYPLPDPIADLRARLYPPLAEIGNRWNAALGSAQRYPATHAEWLALCHDAGQIRPTPLILRY